MILKAFKYELNPNEEQMTMLNKTLGCARFVYNWGLNEKSKAYAKDQTNLTCFDLIKQITELKKTEQFNWLSEVHSQPLQMALRNLDNAYTNFFKKKGKFPNFRKKSRNQSFQYKSEWKGKNYIQIGRFDPSSKRCNCCGHINKDLKLSHRVWTCANCQSVNERDANAALNIRDYGLGFKPFDAKVEQLSSCFVKEAATL